MLRRHWLLSRCLMMDMLSPPAETPLTLTSKLKSPSRVILTLVNGGAIVDYRTVEGATALHKAVERNNFEALKTLLGKSKADEKGDA